METHHDRSNEQGRNFNASQATGGHSVSSHNEDATAEKLNAQRSGEKIDAKRGDGDELNEVDEGNTMGNDDNPADARESGTK